MKAPKSKGASAPQSEPTWRPDKFAGFWLAYPRDEDRAKAVEQWDALPGDQGLMEQYGSEDALLRHRGWTQAAPGCEDWREGRGIPPALPLAAGPQVARKSDRPGFEESSRTGPRGDVWLETNNTL